MGEQKVRVTLAWPEFLLALGFLWVLGAGLDLLAKKAEVGNAEQVAIRIELQRLANAHDRLVSMESQRCVGQ